MNIRHTMSFALLLPLALAACSNPSGGGTGGLTREVAQDFAGDAAQNVNLTVSAVGAGMLIDIVNKKKPILVAVLQQGPSIETADVGTGCVPTTLGDETDNDADGYPVIAIVTYKNCRSEDPAGVIEEERLTLVDRDDTNPFAGYEGQIRIRFRPDDGGPVETIRFDLALDPSATGYRLVQNLDQSVGDEYQRFDSVVDYRPDDLAAPFLAGSLNYSYTLSTRIDGEFLTINAFSNDLHFSVYEDADGNFVDVPDRGNVTYRDEAGNRLLLRYNFDPANPRGPALFYNDQPL